MVVGCQRHTQAAFTPRKYSWYSFLLEAELTPGDIVRSEGYYVNEKSTDTAGIEPATFQIVAQLLKHCTTAVPIYAYKV